jgi:transposase
MKSRLIIGVDVSKLSLDFFFKPSGLQLVLSNDMKGFRKWLGVLKKQLKNYDEVIIVMEHTGHYSFRFERFLIANNIPYCKLSALEIKRSLGLIRGKNDKVDAERIAQYGWLRRDSLQSDNVIGKDLLRLKDLISLRRKLVKDRSGYLSRQREMKETGKVSKGDLVIKIQSKLVDELTEQILVVEREIKRVIQGNEELYNNYRLLITIKGIGFVIAAFMIANTHNFKRFANAKKYNCYAGLAPFTQQSGTSLRGRNKVSHLANKEAKTLMHRAASTAIQHDQELKTYYQNRVANGKKRNNSLNVVMAKLVARMFAVVKRQTPYQPIRLIAA